MGLTMNEKILTEYVKYLLDQRAQLELALIQERQKNEQPKQEGHPETQSGG